MILKKSHLRQFGLRTRIVVRKKRITTTGNVIGTTLTEGVTDETLLAQYLINYYDFPEKVPTHRIFLMHCL